MYWFRLDAATTGRVTHGKIPGTVNKGKKCGKVSPTRRYEQRRQRRLRPGWGVTAQTRLILTKYGKKAPHRACVWRRAIPLKAFLLPGPSSPFPLFLPFFHFPFGHRYLAVFILSPNDYITLCPSAYLSYLYFFRFFLEFCFYIFLFLLM